jgi:hypothetical protein
MLRNLINLPLRAYLKNIYLPVISVVLISIILPLYVQSLFPEGFLRLIYVGFVSVISVGVTVFVIGLTKGERKFFVDKVFSILKIRK